ncbi:hypothetical protein OIU77_007369 [Salix suchowensis]|uniref:Protein argonaute N-terminal domain-containing protein n=1 Tax=Salix suchowensis TaxID=1278906 RepID=A0ABQ9AG12_9ROSI|nr:hypothetical protein OIU77_007369 [Salix suchowensis]
MRPRRGWEVGGGSEEGRRDQVSEAGGGKEPARPVNVSPSSNRAPGSSSSGDLEPSKTGKKENQITIKVLMCQKGLASVSANGISPVLRPDKGGKQAVRTSRLLVNHFLVKFNPKSIILHYDVNIKQEVLPKHGRAWENFKVQFSNDKG